VKLEEGATLADGRYRLECRLGAGGMASVWRAQDTRLGRTVAVKVIADTLAHDESWLARFQREARAAASVSHPNIVKVFDFGVEDDRPYIVMAHVGGGSLKDVLAKGTRLPAAGALARELLDALAHVHAAGILHRDVKPGNILLDDAGRSHLTDFGIARPEDATAMTQPGVVLGTVKYLAPEVAHGDPATPASDLYAAGMVLKETTRPEDPAPLRELIEALTAFDPAHRPASAREALAFLDRAADPTETTYEMPPEEETATVPLAEITAATRAIPRTRRPEPRAARPRPAAAPAPAQRPDLAALRRSPWFAPLAALAGIVVLAIIVIAIASSGGDTSKGAAAAPTPAPRTAPVGSQLDALDAAIDDAAKAR
jgi:serine/threonine protein kinase